VELEKIEIFHLFSSNFVKKAPFFETHYAPATPKVPRCGHPLKLNIYYIKSFLWYNSTNKKRVKRREKMAVIEVKKRALESKKEREKFFTFVDKKIEETRNRIMNKDKRVKSSLVKRLEVVKIVYLLQSWGLRINEAVSLTFSDLKSIVQDDKVEYLVSKTKRGATTKLRTIEFLEYTEYADEYKLLKELIKSFLFEFKGGLFAEKDKEDFYLQRLTGKTVASKIARFKRKLEKELVGKEELKKRLAKFKKLEENQVGYVYAKTPKFVIDFTRLFNKLLKESFGTIVLDSNKVKISKKTGKPIMKTEAELKSAKQTSRYSSHSLRAGFVVTQYREGKDLAEIQKDIKHSDLNQTNAYLVNAKRKAKELTTVEIPQPTVEPTVEVTGKDGITIKCAINQIQQLKDAGIL
jgi:site-specific recombinase XerD